MTKKELDHTKRIAYLIAGHISGSLTQEQIQELDDWIGENDQNMQLFERLTDEDNIQESINWFKQLDVNVALSKFEQQRASKKAGMVRKIVAVAAAVALLVIGSVWLFTNKEKNSGAHTITLQSSKGANSQVTLRDGTKVWLNTNSSLTYPTAFTGNTRSVELTGEAYFEVSPNPQQPFIVRTKNCEILVTGTRFNVNTYQVVESVSLLEGGVQVKTGNGYLSMKPGQEAFVRDNSIALRDVPDIANKIMWTKGLFSFQQSSISEVLNEMSRWYGVQFSFDTLMQHQFTGQFYRNSTLDEALNILSYTSKLSFTRKGNTISVNQP